MPVPHQTGLQLVCSEWLLCVEVWWQAPHHNQEIKFHLIITSLWLNSPWAATWEKAMYPSNWWWRQEQGCSIGLGLARTNWCGNYVTEIQQLQDSPDPCGRGHNWKTACSCSLLWTSQEKMKTIWRKPPYEWGYTIPQGSQCSGEEWALRLQSNFICKYFLAYIRNMSKVVSWNPKNLSG